MAGAKLTKEAVLAQIDAVFARCGASKDNPHPPGHLDDGIGMTFIDGNGYEMGMACIAAIDRLAPKSSYARQAQQVVGKQSIDSYYVVDGLLGVLATLRADVEAGYVESLAELVHADVFADFLDMADELQGKGYKDAAAVIAGSVLEEHLRKLATKTGTKPQRADGTPKKADTINAELAAAGAYNKLEQKAVTAWLGLRNSAAHGKPGEYDHAQVAALIRDVREFMIRHPA